MAKISKFLTTNAAQEMLNRKKMKGRGQGGKHNRREEDKGEFQGVIDLIRERGERGSIGNRKRGKYKRGREKGKIIRMSETFMRIILLTT